MTKWNKLLQALNKTFNTQAAATSKLKRVKRAFDNDTKEHVIWIEHRVKADIFESADSNEVPITESEKYRRSIDVITETTLRAA